MFYSTGVIADGSFTLQEYEFSTFFVPVMTFIYELEYWTRRPIAWRYTGCAKIKLPTSTGQGFRKFSPQTDKQTDRRDRNYIPLYKVARFYGSQCIW